jgi:hypothetical protein
VVGSAKKRSPCVLGLRCLISHRNGTIDKLNLRFGRGTVAFGLATKPMTSKISFQGVPTLDEF